jgi:RHH-type transcriptional regulator, proline utilization regulon repressor / proline dehydrogenase / delta 1-pyrroline-5-carboxylate dehydrogenase
MLRGAMHELAIGLPDSLSIDIGPVIDADAKAALESHIAEMKGNGHKVTQLPLPAECAKGTFVPPTLIEIDSLDALRREVFGPVLHVLRYKRTALDKLLQSIANTGYGLTLGVHTRIDETIDFIVQRAHVGNIEVASFVRTGSASFFKWNCWGNQAADFIAGGVAKYASSGV